MKQKQEKKKNTDIEIQLLMQAYSRYVSRAHTVFETLFEIIFALFSITIALVFALVRVGFIPWNKFYFLIFIFADITICTFIFIIAISIIYDSRKKRAAIVSKIKSLS